MIIWLVILIMLGVALYTGKLSSTTPVWTEVKSGAGTPQENSLFWALEHTEGDPFVRAELVQGIIDDGNLPEWVRPSDLSDLEMLHERLRRIVQPAASL